MGTARKYGESSRRKRGRNEAPINVLLKKRDTSEMKKIDFQTLLNEKKINLGIAPAHFAVYYHRWVAASKSSSLRKQYNTIWGYEYGVMKYRSEHLNWMPPGEIISNQKSKQWASAMGEYLLLAGIPSWKMLPMTPKYTEMIVIVSFTFVHYFVTPYEKIAKKSYWAVD